MIFTDVCFSEVPDFKKFCLKLRDLRKLYLEQERIIFQSFQEISTNLTRISVYIYVMVLASKVAEN